MVLAVGGGIENAYGGSFSYEPARRHREGNNAKE